MARCSGGAPRMLRYALVTGVVLVILGVTLVPVGMREPLPGGLCLVCGERGLANIIGNVLLFLPLGAALALGRLSALRIVLLAALLSACIELTQNFVPGRNPNPTDTLFNALGGAVGVGIVRSSRYWLFAHGAARARLGAAALAAVLAVFAATGALVAPSFPDTIYYGQWTPDRDRLPWHPGRVLEARLGAMHVPSARLENGIRVQAMLTAGEPLEIHAVVGPSMPGPWPIFRIADGQERSILVAVARRWDDLLIRFRTRATALRLHSPEVRVRDAFADVPPGDPVRIRIWRAEGGYCAEVAGTRTCQQGFTIGRGWALVHGIPPLRSPWRGLLDAGWLAGLLLPVGFWLNRPRQLIPGAALVTGALLLTPEFSALLPTPPLEFAGACLGLVAGAAVGHRTGTIRRISVPTVPGARERPA